MRSLYVEDIPGAQPKRHVYPKKVYREKHNEEMFRFARNPEEKRIIDWYVAPQKVTQPLEKQGEDIWRTKRSLRKSLDDNLGHLSKSLILPGKLSESSTQIKQSGSRSVLKSSAKNSLGSFNKSELNPYFPHMYVDTRMGESNKWSGTKNWEYQATKIIQLPTIDKCYFKKWY